MIPKTDLRSSPHSSSSDLEGIERAEEEKKIVFGLLIVVPVAVTTTRVYEVEMEVETETSVSTEISVGTVR